MEHVFSVLNRICQLDIVPNKIQNERYLHHYFSKQIQETYPVNLEKVTESKFHPEWPTYKTQTGVKFGRYKNKEDKGYQIDDIDGTAGFIDFAIGNYSKPYIAVEFTSKYGWSSEEITYDFMKLLDSKNPFSKVISFNLILRNNELSRGKYLTNLEKSMNKAMADAKTRLITKERLDTNVEILFWIIEISITGKKRSWYINEIENDFVLGWPSLT
jgi:hypothetical protein